MADLELDRTYDSGTKGDRVFVVHGRNEAARDAMFAFLRSLGLKPLEWDQAVALTKKGSPYVGEVLDAAFGFAQAIVVLLTPDDVAYLRFEYAGGEADPELEPAGQARPNVLFEAGMAMGRNADRTILVEFGDLRPFSDVGGRHVVRMVESAKARKALAQRLDTAECAVDLSGSDWLSAGDFTPPPKPGDGLPVGKRLPTRDRFGAHVDGNWHDRGSGKFAEIKITNNGALPIFDVEVKVPDGLEGVQLWEAEPVQRLPVGKSFTIRGDNGRGAFGRGGPAQFDLLVVGRLENGAEFSQDVYMDAG